MNARDTADVFRFLLDRGLLDRVPHAPDQEVVQQVFSELELHKNETLSFTSLRERRLLVALSSKGFVLLALLLPRATNSKPWRYSTVDGS